MKQIQIGLYLQENLFLINGVTYHNSILSSANGYCFYDKTEEVYDEEGNVIPQEAVKPNQRKYTTWLKTPLTNVDDINSQYVSVRIESGFEIS